MTTVLLVDDNELIRSTVTRRLARSGYEVLTAENGKEGWDVARAKHPDLILLDMTMPVMDGWTAARGMRSDPDTRDIPIVAFTAHATPDDVEGAIAAGCDDQITKPFEFDELVAKIEHHCRGRRTD